MTTFLRQPFSPALNDGKHIFVFGSNLAGRHSRGAALVATQHWGAIYGQGIGLQGQSYAIPTKNRFMRVMSLPEISTHVANFLHGTHSSPLTFLITPIGTGLAGYQHSDIAPMFKGAPENCVFCEEWREWLA